MVKKMKTALNASLHIIKPVILLVLITLVTSSCTSLYSSFSSDQAIGSKPVTTGALDGHSGKTIANPAPGQDDRIVQNGYIVPDSIQKRIVDTALTLVNKRVLRVRGRTFPPDCTGTVLAAYWGAGLDPVKYFNLYSGNGVKRLYDMGDAYGLGYMHALPNPGDVIIWDDTYDKNGDGKWGDLYTHAGIVMEVHESGQISYLHYNYARGVVIEKMNLVKPDSYTDADETLVNSPMRMRSDRHIKPESWLASHLFKAFIPLYAYPGLAE